MTTSRIEMENVNGKWVIQIEASSFMATKRDVLKLEDGADIWSATKAKYADLLALVTPRQHERITDPDPATDSPKKPGRHKNGCDCPRCVAKRAA